MTKIADLLGRGTAGEESDPPLPREGGHSLPAGHQPLPCLPCKKSGPCLLAVLVMNVIVMSVVVFMPNVIVDCEFVI